MWRAMARLSFFYFLTPAKMSWAMQPCDTREFTLFKTHLAEAVQTVAVSAEGGHVPSTALVKVVCDITCPSCRTPASSATPSSWSSRRACGSRTVRWAARVPFARAWSRLKYGDYLRARRRSRVDEAAHSLRLGGGSRGVPSEVDRSRADKKTVSKDLRSAEINSPGCLQVCPSPLQCSIGSLFFLCRCASRHCSFNSLASLQVCQSPLQCNSGQLIAVSGSWCELYYLLCPKIGRVASRVLEPKCPVPHGVWKRQLANVYSG